MRKARRAQDVLEHRGHLRAAAGVIGRKFFGPLHRLVSVECRKLGVLAMAKQYARIGEQAVAAADKINAELLTMTYGSLVVQLVKDYQDTAVVRQ